MSASRAQFVNSGGICMAKPAMKKGNRQTQTGKASDLLNPTVLIVPLIAIG
jgi:hypothetical protein